MVDTVSPDKRSKMMSNIKNKDTKPEITIRKELFRKGFRYRLHIGRLPGKPDIVLPKYNSVIIINGCFWHGHNCHLFKWPKSRQEFWLAKILGNQQRDKKQLTKLQELKWRTCIVWECALKGKEKQPLHEITNSITNWIKGTDQEFEIRGINPLA